MANMSSMPASSAATLLNSGMNPVDLLTGSNSAANKLKAAGANLSEASKLKAKAASQDFEAVFLNSMFQQMFTGIQGEGPFGGSGATGVWRSFLTDEYSKSFAKAGGIGIADQVYSTLLTQQEARP
jgi:Rod binding domain-containing protein